MGTSAIPAAADERRSNDKDPFMVVLIPCVVVLGLRTQTRET